MSKTSLLQGLYDEATQRYAQCAGLAEDADADAARVAFDEEREWFKIRVAVASKIEQNNKPSAKGGGKTAVQPDDDISNFPVRED